MKNEKSNRWLKIVLPLAVLAVSGVVFVLLKSLRPEVVKQEPPPNYPKIEVYEVTEEALAIEIGAQGTVRPRQQTRLTARVSGHIEWVASSFYEGGRFSKGEVLLKLDPLPYQSALAEAKSRFALARSAYLQELEASEQARNDWQSVGAGEPGPLVLRIPQMERAEADMEAAKVALEVAEDNLSYTEIRAPYEGHVQTKLVDVGQAITAQATILGEIFSTEAFEIPLAINLDDLALIRDRDSNEKPPVRLEGTINGETHTWLAYLDRTAAMIDTRTRMINAFARLDPPFLSDLGSPLTPGMFVAALIQGKRLDSAFRIPRSAMQPGNLVYRVTEGNRLESIILKVVRTDAQWAVVTSGLNKGDRICLTPLLFFVEDMRVEIADTQGE